MKSILEFVVKHKLKHVNIIDVDELTDHIIEEKDYKVKINNIKVTISSFTSRSRNTWLTDLSDDIKHEIVDILYMYFTKLNKDTIHTTNIDFRIIKSSTADYYLLIFSIYKDITDVNGQCNTKYTFPINSNKIPKTFEIIPCIANKKENATIDDLVNFIKTGKL